MERLVNKKKRSPIDHAPKWNNQIADFVEYRKEVVVWMREAWNTKHGWSKVFKVWRVGLSGAKKNPNSMSMVSEFTDALDKELQGNLPTKTDFLDMFCAIWEELDMAFLPLTMTEKKKALANYHSCTVKHGEYSNST